VKPALSLLTPVLRTQEPRGWHRVLGCEVAAFIAVAGEGAAAVRAAVVGLVAAADAPAATATAVAAIGFSFGGGGGGGGLVSEVAVTLAAGTGGGER